MERQNHRRGFTLLATAVSAAALFGMAGLAVDIGRMYITKNEAQSYADSAALYAAQQLDGTANGLTNADNAVNNNPNQWNFGTTAFSGTLTEYSVNGTSGWATSGSVANPATIRYVRVTPTVSNVALFFLPVIGAGTSTTVKASAVAGQIANPNGAIVFPYSPIANVDATNSSQLPTTGDPFGFTPGVQYDLKWPASATLGTLGANKVPCAGDNNQTMLNRETGATSEWGSIVLQSAAALSAQVTDDGITGVDVTINQSVSPTNGQKNSLASSFAARSAQDPNQTDLTYPPYDASTTKNGRRLITVVVNSGFSNSSGVAYPANQQAVALGYAQFLLLPSSYYTQAGGANNAWCAVYVGPYSGYNIDGAPGTGSTQTQLIVRLVQ